MHTAAKIVELCGAVSRDEKRLNKSTLARMFRMNPERLNMLERNMSKPDDNLEDRDCTEDRRLRKAYKTALFAWSLDYSCFINGVYSVEATSGCRRELLDARLKAIDELYDHSVNCEICKPSKR